MNQPKRNKAVEDILERMRIATAEQMSILLAGMTYARQNQHELMEIAKRMPYSRDQQVLMRFSNDSQLWADNNARALASCKQMGRLLGKVPTLIGQPNAAKRSGSAA